MQKAISPERFWSKVAIGGPDDCWPWTAASTDTGYGVFRNGKKYLIRSHRVAFFLTHGEWPQICRHKCDNRICVNPAHLEDGTHGDNMRDAVERGRTRNQNKGKTHCHRGHPLEGDNLYVYKDGSRLCRTCNRHFYKDSRRR